MSKLKELTKEQIESIKGYGGKIKSLKDFIEACRKRPTMYIGYIGNRGFERMFREIFQNAVDEVERKDSPCDKVMVTYDERSHTIIVEDNGRGIPHGHIIRIYTKQHTSVNFEKELYVYGAGTNGVGGKVTNALSKKFIVESYVFGKGKRVEFDEGYAWDKGEVDIPNKENRQGSIVLFNPADMMGTITTAPEDIFRIMSEILPLTSRGTKFIFKGINMNGKETNTTIVNDEGIMSFLYDSCAKPLIKPIMFGQDTGVMRVSVLFTYDISEGTDGEIVNSFSNFCATDPFQSSHTAGFYAGIKKFFIKYMNRVYLNTINSKGKKTKKPLSVIESDIRYGLRAVIDAAHLEPNFTGQAKDILYMPEVAVFTEGVTIEMLDLWAKSNPQDLQKLCKYFKDVATMRSSMDEKKVKLQNQYSSTISGLPSKYIPPTETCEDLLICEGDSAGGSMENNRNNKTQGIFPIKGMITNCFEKDEKTCLSNPEVAGIITIIGGGYGKSFDITKVKWKKIIFATDADSAGAFIASLLLRLILRFMPQLILEGRVYRVIPPLYYINLGGKKGKMYFTDKIDLVKYVRVLFMKTNELTTIDNNKLTARDIEILLYDNDDYVYEIDKIANRYSINPIILEIYLNNRTKSVDEICKLIAKRFRFMKKVIINGHSTCDGIADSVSNTLIISERMLRECENIINIMKNNIYNYYRLNGEISSIYEIMKAYKESEPANITRLKGLGEQDPAELAETVVYPGEMGNRVLEQYTMSAAMTEIEEIRVFESNKSKLLEDLVVTRSDITD